jgi:uncharacterized protein
MGFSIRKVRSGDIDEVLELNESVVPAVNSLTRSEMEWFVENSAWFHVAADREGVGAFLVGLRAGADYGSPNYQWFCRHYQEFAYVDRVAVAPRARRLGLASRLYDAFAAAVREDVEVMTCEVNLRPPNPSSMRFHEQRGFRQIASQETENGNKEVALMELRL